MPNEATPLSWPEQVTAAQALQDGWALKQVSWFLVRQWSRRAPLLELGRAGNVGGMNASSTIRGHNWVAGSSGIAGFLPLSSHMLFTFMLVPRMSLIWFQAPLLIAQPWTVTKSADCAIVRFSCVIVPCWLLCVAVALQILHAVCCLHD